MKENNMELKEHERKLTGDCYLKKGFFGGYKVMVQVLSDGVKRWEKASTEDLIEIGIKIG